MRVVNLLLAEAIDNVKRTVSFSPPTTLVLLPDHAEKIYLPCVHSPRPHKNQNLTLSLKRKKIKFSPLSAHNMPKLRRNSLQFLRPLVTILTSFLSRWRPGGRQAAT
jgi:hypothetical protein